MHSNKQETFTHINIDMRSEKKHNYSLLKAALS